MAVQHAFDGVPAVAATHDRADDAVAGTLLLQLGRRRLQVQRHGGGQHLDVANFLGCGVHQHVAVFRVRPARAPGLEKVLHANAYFAFHAPDRLLQHAGKNRIGCFDLDGILKTFVVIEH